MVFDNEDDEFMNEYVQDKIEMSDTFIDCESIQRYDRGETESMCFILSDQKTATNQSKLAICGRSTEA